MKLEINPSTSGVAIFTDIPSKIVLIDFKDSLIINLFGFVELFCALRVSISA
jgi:hypothetical protein